MNDSDGKAEAYGKVIEVCVSCAWKLYDIANGDVEIVESL